MLDWVPGRPLDIVGLLLVVMGVGLLLAPTVPPLARRFRFGRLEAAQRALVRDGLTPGDTGFDELVGLFNRSLTSEEVVPRDVIRISLDRRVIESDEEASPTKEYRFLFEYADHVGEPVSSYLIPPEPIYPEFRHAIDRGKRLFRVAGSAYIAFGFLLQFGATYTS